MIELINTPHQLHKLVEALDGAPWVAIDTEFLREKTYRAVLCLIQVATPEVVACVDALAFRDLSPLLDRLFEPELLKVFHAAGQDLEIFHDIRGEVLAPVFDTQIAAPLLGHAHQVGYAALVAAELGVELGKGLQRTDWTRRPLDPRQLEYAADDVIYLSQLYPELRDKLAARDRLAWLDDDFAEATRPDRFVRTDADVWRKVKGLSRLRGQQLSIAQHLALWREERAADRDRPARWIMKDEALIDVARQHPKSLDDLRLVRGLGERFADRMGGRLLELVAEAARQEPTRTPRSPRSVQLDDAQAGVVDVLTAVVKQRALAEGIHASLLASRKDLERLVAGEPSAVTAGWRRKVVGDALRQVLRGDAVLRIEGGELLIETPGG